MSAPSSSSGAYGPPPGPRLVTSIPKAALKALEPRPGGRWVVEPESEGAFRFVYIMGEEEVTVYYTLRPCSTEEEIRDNCKDFIYDMPRPAAQIGNPQQMPAHNNPAGTFLPTTLPPQHQPTQVHGQFGHGVSIAGPPNYAMAQNIGGTSALMPAPSHSGQSFGPLMNHTNAQPAVSGTSEQNGVQQSPMSVAPPPSATGNNWPMHGNLLPQMGENTENTMEFNSPSQDSYGPANGDWNQFFGNGFSNGYNPQ
ncbi:unnamed protein product [Clonostachys chloroleuca]|uniref:Uncharacterized protein n=1 Tax=Clonostachys chloroleuca TaxID=1926264 RepID=A0AA35MEJ7_9HYPO|nr:unnamed protein product [Clonostachys chloroleuca]